MESLDIRVQLLKQTNCNSVATFHFPSHGWLVAENLLFLFWVLLGNRTMVDSARYEMELSDDLRTGCSWASPPVLHNTHPAYWKSQCPFLPDSWGIRSRIKRFQWSETKRLSQQQFKFQVKGGCLRLSSSGRIETFNVSRTLMRLYKHLGWIPVIHLWSMCAISSL